MASPARAHNNGISNNMWQHVEAPKCPVCFQELGTHGGLAVLGCGHKACLQCLQQVQDRSVIAQCPLCQHPFGNNMDRTVALEFEWPRTPKFDENPNEGGAADSEAEEFEEPYFRPCVYEEFNTWTPTKYAQHNETGNSCRTLSCADETGCVTHSVNAKDVAKGALSVLSKSITVTQEQDLQLSQHGVLSRGLDETWASVHIPSAPPLFSESRDGNTTMRKLLEAEPPQWVPDSEQSNCKQCNARFQPLTRGRHHCRFCGRIFCRSCSKGKCLLPIKFMQRDPQRVCDGCYESLEPIQGFLVNIISNAAQVAVHDVTDSTCMRSWLNNPVGLCMEDEIYKATNTVRNFCKVGEIKSEQAIPAAVLRGAKGLAILTVVKVGMVLTYKAGTGLLLARRDDGSWSPPAAITSFGLGWGIQVGGELVDFIIVLQSRKAVKAFSGRMHVSIGAGLSASVGPLGRLAEADIRVGDKGTAACYTYSCSQGAFVGASFEGNVVTSRAETNTRFYGDAYLTPDYILFGPVPKPKAAAPLYKALGLLFGKVHG